VKSNHYSRQTRRARLCIKVRTPRPGPSVASSRNRVALLVARGGDLAGEAARAAERIELPAEITELLSLHLHPDRGERAGASAGLERHGRGR
jgi:hypothetical protein